MLSKRPVEVSFTCGSSQIFTSFVRIPVETPEEQIEAVALTEARRQLAYQKHLSTLAIYHIPEDWACEECGSDASEHLEHGACLDDDAEEDECSTGS